MSQRRSRAGDIGEKTLVDWLVQKYPEVKLVGDNPQERPGIVHRLDKDTSGILLIARNQKAFEALKQLFKERKVRKIYLALVIGAPKRRAGTIELAIGRSRRDRRKRAIGPAATAPRPALTHYQLLERLGAYSLLKIRPHTGRMHQIRVHLAAIQLPIAGDTLYGGKQAWLPGLRRHFLHAAAMEFSYPEGRRLRFEAKLPQDLDRVLKQLRRLKK